MIWYRLNINYLSKEYNNKALDTSHPCGDDKQNAINEYLKAVGKKEKCIDNSNIFARIELTKYTHNKKTKTTTQKILIKNY